jgi:hypothetical protein
VRERYCIEFVCEWLKVASEFKASDESNSRRCLGGIRNMLTQEAGIAVVARACKEDMLAL